MSRAVYKESTNGLQAHARANYESILNVKPTHSAKADEIGAASAADAVPPDGFRLLRGYLTPEAQAALVETLRTVVRAAPFYTPTMPRTGRPMRVRMTNCGALGWITDKQGGYRYQAFHPQTGKPWPAMPQALIELWQTVTGLALSPEACLVNFYDEAARMGLHQDRDEADLSVPVVSISLGDSCRFRVGGTQRGGKTVAMQLDSGDVVVLGGKARLAYHGVDRIMPGTSDLLEKGGRINLTLRRVNAAAL